MLCLSCYLSLKKRTVPRTDVGHLLCLFCSTTNTVTILLSLPPLFFFMRSAIDRFLHQISSSIEFKLFHAELNGYVIKSIKIKKCEGRWTRGRFQGVIIKSSEITIFYVVYNYKQRNNMGSRWKICPRPHTNSTDLDLLRELSLMSMCTRWVKWSEVDYFLDFFGLALWGFGLLALFVLLSFPPPSDSSSLSP